MQPHQMHQVALSINATTADVLSRAGEGGRNAFPCGESSVTLLAHCEAELAGPTLLHLQKKHSSSTAMTTTVQEIHRPILNAEYQNTTVL